MATTRTRSERLEVRTTKDERALIDRAVAEAETDLTEFVISNLTVAARRVLADRVEFSLDAEAAQAWEEVNRRRARELPAPGADDLQYEVLLEPTMQTWLYSLANAASQDVGVYRTVDDRLESRDPVLSVFRYRATSHRGAARRPRSSPARAP